MRRPELRELAALPSALRICAIFYLLHILWQGRTAGSELTAFMAIVFLIWALARQEMRFSFHLLYFPLFLYGLASTLSAVVNRATIHHAFDVMTWFKMMIFPTALLLYRASPSLRELALRAQLLFGTAIAINGLYQFFALEQRDLDRRITGTSTHVMTYSGLLLPLSLLAVVLAAHRKQIWLILSATLISLALLLTLTRSAWLGWGVAMFVLLALKRTRWVPLAVAALLLFLSFMPLALFGRLASVLDLQQSSNLDRIRMAEAGVEIIRDYPLFGVGPANVKEIYPLYRKPDAPRFRPPHLHNNVIQLWAERGLIGLAAYVILIVLFLRECARGWGGRRREFAEAGAAVAVGLTYAGLFEFNFGDTEVFYITLELFALIVAFLEGEERASLNEPAQAGVIPRPALGLSST